MENISINFLKRIETKINPNKVYTAEYWSWINLKYPILSEIDEHFCSEWIREALLALKREGVDKLFVSNGIQDKRLYEKYGEWGHVWLSSPKQKDIFIADGTAHQFDSKYTQGFFGKLDDSSPTLKWVYNLKYKK